MAPRSSRRASYTMASFDMRMAPGWDGLKPIERLWDDGSKTCRSVILFGPTPDSTGQSRARLGHSDSCWLLRKPDETQSRLQCATDVSRSGKRQGGQRTGAGASKT